MKNYDIVGQPIKRIDAYEKVTGKARYVGDMKLPGMLYAKIFRSSKAHAIVKSVNIEKAKALDGVVTVLTYDDCPDIPFTTCGHPLPFDTPLDSRMLNKHVRYVGDPIAVVAAESQDIADAAVDLIEVEYVRCCLISIKNNINFTFFCYPSGEYRFCFHKHNI